MRTLPLALKSRLVTLLYCCLGLKRQECGDLEGFPLPDQVHEAKA